jgi:hypothetical protein
MRCPPISRTRFPLRHSTLAISGQTCKPRGRPATRCGHFRKRASWVAAQASWACGRCVACRPISTRGLRPAPKVGAGPTCCPITASWKTISTAIKVRPRTERILSGVCHDTNGRHLFQRSSGPLWNVVCRWSKTSTKSQAKAFSQCHSAKI